MVLVPRHRQRVKHFCWEDLQVVAQLQNLGQIHLSPFELDNRGVNITIAAMSGCFGPCISNKDPLVFRGFIEFNIAP